MTEKAKTKTTFRQKILLIAFGFIILFILELMLHLFNIGDRDSQNDPFVGFEKVYPLFGEIKKANGEIVYATNTNKLSFFNIQEFAKKKQGDTFRIFCFGGSTTYGRPYKADTAFPKWLEINLNILDPSRKYEVINAGGISYASYRIVHLIEEAVQYEPDLFVIYSGHNEFLEARTYEEILAQNPALKRIRVLMDKLRIYTLLRNSISKAKQSISKTQKNNILKDEVATILDDVAGIERYARENLQMERTLEHFKYNLEKIIALAKKHHIPIVLSTVACNLRDFSPFKSEHKDNLSQQDLDAWNQFYQQGQEYQKQKKWQHALISYEKCFSLDDQYAELSYNIAQCLFNSEQFDLAKKYYFQAKELDICPLRAPFRINQTIKIIAKREKIPLVNIEAEIEKISPHRIPNSDFLIDHVHPTIQANQIIAEKIAFVLRQEKIISDNAEIDPDIISANYRKALSSLPDEYYSNGLLNLAKVLGWAGKQDEKIKILKRNSTKLQGHYEYYYMLGNSALQSGEPFKAIEYFNQSLALNPGFSETYTNLGFALSRAGSPDKALENYEKALLLNENDYVAQTNIGRIYYIKNDFTRALEEYKKAIPIKKDYPQIYEGLGVIYYKQGNTKRALEELNRAIELNPNYSEAYFDIGLIYHDQHKFEAAIEKFKKAIEINPLYADAYSSLGVCYYNKKMLNEAIINLEKAVSINPNIAKVHNNLAVAYHSAGKYDLSWEHVKIAQNMKYKIHPQFIEMLEKDSKMSQQQ